MEDAQERAQALAAAAKTGDTAAVNELWAAYADFINNRVSWWYAHHEEQAKQRGLEKEDFEQEGYFALRRAAELYEPDAGMMFTTYLWQRISVSCIRLLKRGSSDPLNDCTSLDIEISGNGDGDKAEPLTDFVPDNSAEAAMLAVDEADYQSALHEGLEAALNKLQKRDADMLRRRYYQGQEVNYIASAYGISRQSTSTLINNSLRKLRTAPELQEYHDEIIAEYAWHNCGFEAWRQNGSVEERALEGLQRYKLLVARILEKPQPQACP